MDSVLGSVFATHGEVDATCMAANLLTPIGVEPNPWGEGTPAEFEPSPKRMRMNYDCDLCGVAFTEKRSFIRHCSSAAHCRRLGQPSKQVFCHVCFASFTRDDVRQRHERERHGNARRAPPRVQSHQIAIDHPEATSRPINTSSATSRVQWLLQDIDSIGPGGAECQMIDVGLAEPSTSPHPHFLPDQTLTGASSSTSSRSRDSSLGEVDVSSSSSLKPTSTNTSWTTYSLEQSESAVAKAVNRSIPTFSHDHSSVRSVRGSERSRKSASFSIHSRFSLIRSGANRRPGSATNARACLLCKTPFDNTVIDVRSHLNRHYEEFKGAYNCSICQIGFQHKRDLDYHLTCAQKGHCGLAFTHQNKCTGHHPPTPHESTVSDSDRSKLCQSLWKWQEPQVRAYRELVTEIIENVPGDSDSWSIDGVLRKSIHSVSILFSSLDIRSTPSYAEHHLRTAVQHVRRTVSDKVFHGRSASLRISIEKKATNDIRLLKALIEASGVADIKKMDELIRRGACINGYCKVHKNRPACTPLTAAVCSNSVKAVDLLLSRGANVNGLKSDVEHTVVSPLCVAADSGNLAIMECLLKHDADVNSESKGRSGHAACFAARNGHTEILSTLIEAGADIRLKATMDRYVDDEMQALSVLPAGNMLALATFHGRLKTVEMLLTCPKIDKYYCDTSWAMTLAAYQGNRAIIGLLLQYHPGLCTYLALWVADTQGHKGVVDFLLSHQRETKSSLPLRSERVLRHAIKHRQQDLVSRLLSPHHGHTLRCDELVFSRRHFEANFITDLTADRADFVASPDCVNLARALNCAVYYGHSDTVRILLEHGASVTAISYRARHRWLTSTLALATYMGSVEIVGLLLRIGGWSRPMGLISYDVLEAALESDNVEMLRLLLGSSAALEPKRDRWECSPLNAAVQRLVRRGMTEFVEILVDHSLDVNQVHVDDITNADTTLLHLSAAAIPKNGCIEMTRLLMRAGADAYMRLHNRTPLDILQHKLSLLNNATEAYCKVNEIVKYIQLPQRYYSVGAHSDQSTDLSKRITNYSRTSEGGIA